METVDQIRQIQAHMVTARSAASDDPEVSHAHTDDAVYLALGLIVSQPDSEDVRALAAEVDAFATESVQWERWYA